MLHYHAKETRRELNPERFELVQVEHTKSIIKKSIIFKGEAGE